MEPYKLHIKIGPHEFHGEGSEERVRADFEEWKNLITGGAAPQKPGQAPTPQVIGVADVMTPGDADTQRLNRLFLQDDKGVISLKIRPTTETPVADALLLILLGYKLLKNKEDVLVTQLNAALDKSGTGAGERIDRAPGVSSYLRDNLIIKGGRARGGRYQLSNTGVARAQALMESMLAQVS